MKISLYTLAAASRHLLLRIRTEKVRDPTLHPTVMEQDHVLQAVADSVAMTFCQIYQCRCGHLNLMRKVQEPKMTKMTKAIQEQMTFASFMSCMKMLCREIREALLCNRSMTKPSEDLEHAELRKACSAK